MTTGPSPRRPAAFRLDDPDVTVSAEDQATGRNRSGTTILLAPEPEPSLPVATAFLPPQRRFRWGRMFWIALGGLVSLAIGLGIAQLIESLFARSASLGWLGAGLAALTVLALVVVIGREVRSLMKLAAVESLRERAAAVIASDDRDAGRAVLRDLLKLFHNAPAMARSRTNLETHLDEIIDGADLIRLAERELMSPLDREARRLVSAAAKRVSVVTAVSPRAAVDMLFVLISAAQMIRRLAQLYGARPGTLGLFRLIRLVISHLAVTGSMAVGDSLLQQVVGQGLAARLSARLGEGVLNGLLTARLGLAAIDMTRPMPFVALPRPALSDLAGDLLRRSEDPAATGKPARPDEDTDRPPT